MINNRSIAMVTFGALVFIYFVYYLQLGGGNGIEVQQMSVKQTRQFKQVFVHLDLKGAPPRVEYVKKVLAILAQLSVDGILVEYEDMFPYTGPLETIARSDAYSRDDVLEINRAARYYGLEVIPLIQTFGHLEFVLKKSLFMGLSEHPIEKNSLCISDAKSLELIREMIVQVRQLHPNSTRVHIGADEAYHVAEDIRCSRRMKSENLNVTQIKLKHIASVGEMAHDIGFSTVFAWNDMFDKDDADLIRSMNVQKFIVPVVWGYSVDVTKRDYFPDGLFQRLDDVFDEFYLASAFKGANGQKEMFIDVERYLKTHKSYVQLMDMNKKASRKAQGIFVTGWSRFSHFLPLCELLPVSIPSLVANLIFINYQQNDDLLWKHTKSFLKCAHSYEAPLDVFNLKGCQFEGSRVFELIMHDWHKCHSELKCTEEEINNVLKTIEVELKPILFEKDIADVVGQLKKSLDERKREEEQTKNING